MEAKVVAYSLEVSDKATGIRRGSSTSRGGSALPRNMCEEYSLTLERWRSLDFDAGFTFDWLDSDLSCCPLAPVFCLIGSW